MTVLAGAAALAGCAQVPPGAQPPVEAATWSVPAGPGPALTPVDFAQVPGWTTDKAAQALPAFLASCDQMASAPAQQLGGQGEAAARGGTPAQWQASCAAARAVPPGDDAAARSFFEAAFQPFGLSSDGSAQGLFTGYYEPEVAGARAPGGIYRYPIYRRPADLPPGRATPYFSRADIEAGALNRKRLELLWLADPIDVFFLHIQGAGRIRLPNGQIVRVSYDGQNGQTYVPIGRVLVDRGEMTLDQVSMQTIRGWLVSHPEQAREVMNQNPSYVFFREVNGVSADVGPPGALGAPLAPGRSVAVDKGYIPLGAPLWIDTLDPLDGSKMRRVMVAQDLGGAIRGPVRADIFFGWGKEAEERAGRMRQQGIAFLFLPKASQTAAR
ncbi:murein transglycosylase A [Limobrevibacterium gyesilva]|nr:MltA domain-containing protein [Limobrevibacterium gyesilva]